MLTPTKPAKAADVARHYDELDYFYRTVWGEHVHHGVWEDGHDEASVPEATGRLLELATEPLRLSKGDPVGDIGCGYGGAARWMAEQFGARVTGFTLSTSQAAFANAQPEATDGSVHVLVQDWLHNDLPDHKFAAAVAIESLAHMPDKPAFFRELFRTLKPGGRAALACWLTAPDPHFFERHLLARICEEGRLPGMGTFADYHAMAEAAGFRVLAQRDLTREVERTWWIIARRIVVGLFTNSRFIRFVCNRAFRERIFALTLPRLLIAYRTGAMRYGLIWLERPRS